MHQFTQFSVSKHFIVVNIGTTLYALSFFSYSICVCKRVHEHSLKINGAHQIHFFMQLYLNEYKLKQLKRKLMKQI